jgi:prepilin peptidase CpaA
MFYIVCFYICLVSVVIIAFLISKSDWQGLTISNKYSVIVIALFFLAYGITYAGGYHSLIFAPFYAHLLSALIIFVLTFLMFAFRLMGAADSKIATAYALWLGLHDITLFFIVWSLTGALIAILAKLCKNWEKWPKAKDESDLIGVKQGQNAVPYGIAIAIGAIAALIHHGYFNAFALI